MKSVSVVHVVNVFRDDSPVEFDCFIRKGQHLGHPCKCQR